MKKAIKRFLDFLLYSNIFIAVCAAAMSAETYLLIHGETDPLYPAFVFFATLSLYNFPALLNKELPAGDGYRIVARPMRIVFFAGGALASFIPLFFLPQEFIFWFMPAAALSLFYFFPRGGLRGIPGMKTILVALVWTGTTALFPLLLEGMSVHQSLPVICANFLFIVPLCEIFNVRDIEADRNAGIKTIPVVFGVRITVFICTVFHSLFIVLTALSPAFGVARNGLVLSALISAVLLTFASEDRSDYYYLLGVDGMILLKAGLLFLFFTACA